ncbi:MAG: GDP-mannose 4,6-dehydratase [Methanosarcinaceae archaeon]|nr:GDP-mannose 4,6-dehydratase [Methanosarcinaceae archaeon]
MAEREHENARIINLDLLTYAGHLMNLESRRDDPEHIFIQGSIGDRVHVQDILEKYHPNAVENFAAESHVDCTSLLSLVRLGLPARH